MEREAAIQRQFDRAAAAYGTSAIFAQGHDLALMIEAGAPTAEMAVLDVGTAAGHTAFAFAPHVREVVGVDLSAGMLAEAARLAKARGITNVRWEQAGAQSLPFADGTFDIVTCRMVCHHFPALTPGLREMARVLKPGGQLLIVDVISPENAALEHFINRIELLRDASHGHDWTLTTWAAAGNDAGTPFAVAAQWMLPLDFADWTARQQTPPDAVAALEALFDAAPPEAREAFAVTGPPERGFRLWAALLRGVKG